MKKIIYKRLSNSIIAFFIICVLYVLAVSCKSKSGEIRPTHTYVIHHNNGMDTVQGKSVYTFEKGVIIYGNSNQSDIVGKFNAPYYLKVIK